MTPFPRVDRALLTFATLTCLTVVLNGCGSDSPSDPGGDDGITASVDVGPGGGSVEILGADGTRYHLEVPPGALDQTTRITLRLPNAGIDDDGFGALGSGIVLEPAGLRFEVPARITVEPAATWGGDRAPAVLHRSGDEPAVLLATSLQDGVLRAPIEHFSSTVPVAPAEDELSTHWAELLDEIDAQGPSLGRAEALIGMYLHATANPGIYGTLDTAAWLDEISTQLNDLVVAGSLNCVNGDVPEGEFVLARVRELAFLLSITFLVEEADAALADLCVEKGPCPDASCDPFESGSIGIGLGIGPGPAEATCGELSGSDSEGNKGREGRVGYGYARTRAWFDIENQVVSGSSASASWYDYLLITSSDPELRFQYGYLVARFTVTIAADVDTRENSVNPALGKTDIYSSDLEYTNGRDFDINSQVFEGGGGSGTGPGVYEFDVKYVFQFGVPRALRLTNRVTATWQGVTGVNGNARVEVEATSRWLGVTGAFLEDGTPIEDFSICAMSGTDYTVAAPAP